MVVIVSVVLVFPLTVPSAVLPIKSEQRPLPSREFSAEETTPASPPALPGARSADSVLELGMEVNELNLPRTGLQATIPAGACSAVQVAEG